MIAQTDARPGYVVAKTPKSDDEIARFNNLVQAYEKFNKQIEYKPDDEWDAMTSFDFEQYDAVIVVDFKWDCPSTDPNNYYNPFSNSVEWGNAVKHGNTIILATQELELPEHMDYESFQIIDAAVAFSLYNTHETSALISLGPMYHKCTGISSVWLDQAFGSTDHLDDNKAFAILKNYSGRNFNRVIGSHPALNNLNNDTFKRKNGRSSSLAMFRSYPDGFIPFAVVTSHYNSPFILWREGNRTPHTAAPSSSPHDTSTKSPTAILSMVSSHPSAKMCIDDPSFFVNDDPTKTCNWIGQSATRLDKFCGKLYVKVHCPRTCNIDCNNSSVGVMSKPSRIPSTAETSPVGPSYFHQLSLLPFTPPKQTDMPSTSVTLRMPTKGPSQQPSDHLSSSPSLSKQTFSPSSIRMSSRSSSNVTSKIVEQVAPFLSPCKGSKSSKSSSRNCTLKLSKIWKRVSKPSSKSKKSGKSRFLRK